MGLKEHLLDATLVFDSVLLALGLASNLFVCFMMARGKLIRKSLSNFYIFHLSVAEVLYRMVLVILKILTSMIDYRLISNTECKAMAFWPDAEPVRLSSSFSLELPWIVKTIL